MGIPVKAQSYMAGNTVMGGVRHVRHCLRVGALMGWEPNTYCKECGEPFDVYRAPDERLCDDCLDFFAERDSRAAFAWYETMEEIDRERTRQDQA